MTSTRLIAVLAGFVLAVLVAIPAQAVDDAIIVGGVDAVSPDVEAELNALGLAPQRIRGNNRYATAVDASMRLYPATAPVVVLASGRQFADGMAGVPLASSLDAPLLLTARNALPDVTRNEIERLDPDLVVVLGGEAAVAAPVLAEVAGLGPVVDRVAGRTRWATAAAMAESLGGTGGTAYVVRGDVFADALAIGPAAGSQGSPILFTRTDALPRDTVAALRRRAPDTITIVGGTGAVSPAVEDELRGLATNVGRLGGDDRHETSALIAADVFGPRPDRILIATSTQFPDAFTAGPPWDLDKAMKELEQK